MNLIKLLQSLNHDGCGDFTRIFTPNEFDIVYGFKLDKQKKYDEIFVSVRLSPINSFQDEVVISITPSWKTRYIGDDGNFYFEKHHFHFEITKTLTKEEKEYIEKRKKFD